MILGIGVEWVDVPRFEAALQRFGPRVRERVFTATELAYADRKNRGQESLAVRFAAKVAGRRALRAQASWQELEVVRERGRAPQLLFHGRAAAEAHRLGVERVTLTLTHDAACCIGQVVLEGGR